MNPIDAVIATISPAWAASRMRHRMLIQAYEAAQPSRMRKPRREDRSGDRAVAGAGVSIREQAIAQDEDHDLVVGILNTFTINTVGPKGIQVEPQPRRLDGSLHIEFAKEILELRRDWERQPETTGELDNATMERLACLTWARDGECFGQHLAGKIRSLEHGTRVPYSVELIEPSMCPIELDDPRQGIVQGVRRNEWGRPTAYYIYHVNPNDIYQYRIASINDTRPIAADRILHVKLARRIRQARGVSILAPVLTRLQDLKDYETSERVAAKMAAAMAMYVKKGTPDMFDSAETGVNTSGDEFTNKLQEVAAGMMWVNLGIGEEVGTIDTTRPSNLLAPFRESMLRAACSGTGTGYSTVSRNYAGTYSAQRQELVEQFTQYAATTGHFVAQWSRPVYLRMLATSIAARELIVPADVDPRTIDDAEYRGPVMPWIDPTKEAQANLMQVQAGFKSRSQVIRERGGVPQNTENEIERERNQDADRGLVFSSNYEHQATNAPGATENQQNTGAAA